MGRKKRREKPEWQLKSFLPQTKQVIDVDFRACVLQEVMLILLVSYLLIWKRFWTSKTWVFNAPVN